MRISQRERDEMMDEHVRRMGEPEPYRSLRLQKERIEHEERCAREKEEYDRQAERLRKEIADTGHTPCA